MSTRVQRLLKDPETLHLMTQDNQPYGSVRHCCEECGIMIWPLPQPTWTDDRKVYANPPAPYKTCCQILRTANQPNIPTD